MKFGVVTFPGSNCDEDMVYVIKNQLGQEVERLWHKDTDLKGVDFVVLPGGFSYGDYLRSGAIARFAPIMSEVIRHANKGGYVLGVCNGFQILCESGLVEGALLHNLSQTFICKNVFIKPGSGSAPINENLESRAFKIPIAHGEGRFYAPNDTLQSIVEHEQIIFQYCDKDGQVNDESNPNGSLLNIAGITNRKKNVFGMMPHPERAADRVLSNIDGRLIFDSLLRFC